MHLKFSSIIHEESFVDVDVAGRINSNVFHLQVSHTWLLTFSSAYIINCNNAMLCKKNVFLELSKYFDVLLCKPEQDVIHSNSLRCVTF